MHSILSRWGKSLPLLLAMAASLPSNLSAQAPFPAEARGPRLEVPPFPANLDLASVERLYKSAAYEVEVRRAGTVAYSRCFVFETRNDWVVRDLFGVDKTKILVGANEYGGFKSFLRTASFAQFSFADTAVEIKVTLKTPGLIARRVTIRPLRHAIAAHVSPDGRTITFTLSHPLKVSIEINDRLNPLFLFTDAPDVPDRAATYYFGPGLHRIPGKDGRLTLTSNQRVYIAAGAIVEGRFLIAEGSTHVTIRGRGILSMGEWPHTSRSTDFLAAYSTFRSKGTDHLLVEGLTLVQGTGWTLSIDDRTGDETHDNEYRNLKMVHWAGNTDAFWITGNHNRVDDCFVFNNDDVIVTKGGNGSVVSNLVMWTGIWGNLTLLFNFGRPITNLTIENVDVIGKEGGPQLIVASRKGGPIDISGIVYRNIRVEERKHPDSRNLGRFLRLDADRVDAQIHDWLFEDITLDQQFQDEGTIAGSESRGYHGFTFRNLRMGGRWISNAADSHLRFNPFVTEVLFELPASKAAGSSGAPRTNP